MKQLRKLAVVLLAVLLVNGCGLLPLQEYNPLAERNAVAQAETLEEVPGYTDEPYVIINQNKPEFD